MILRNKKRMKTTCLHNNQTVVSNRLKTFIPYIGSKGKLADAVINHFDKHTCYVEVFAGASNVLFRKEPSEVEVINDINRDLITLYRVVQNHLDEFIKQFQWSLVSRDEFNRFMSIPPETLTDIQRAVRIYYLQRSTYGGKVAGRSFGYSPKSKARFNVLNVEESLKDIHLRLARVYIECLPYQDILDKYDRAETLFYLDPPYDDCENYYGKGIFSKDDFNILADKLKRLKGKFVLSLNNTANIRETFKDFKQFKVKTTYTVNNIENKQVSELIIRNY